MVVWDVNIPRPILKNWIDQEFYITLFIIVNNCQIHLVTEQTNTVIPHPDRLTHCLLHLIHPAWSYNWLVLRPWDNFPCTIPNNGVILLYHGINPYGLLNFFLEWGWISLYTLSHKSLYLVYHFGDLLFLHCDVGTPTFSLQSSINLSPSLVRFLLSLDVYE